MTWEAHRFISLVVSALLIIWIAARISKDKMNTAAPRQIMQYVRELEGKVLTYRAREHRFYARWFLLGALTGAACVSAWTLWHR